MKVRKFKKVILLLVSLQLTLAAPVTTLVAAETGREGNGHTSVQQSVRTGDLTVNNDVNAANARVKTNIGMGDSQYTVNVMTDVDLVYRTQVNLDAAKYVNIANVLRGDYKPNIKDSLLDLTQEFSYADIIEYTGFTGSDRNSVSVADNSTTDYASKLEYLINHNLINRTTYYMYNADNVFISENRVPRPDVLTSKDPDKTLNGGDKKGEEEDSAVAIKHKYYFPDHKLSKSDFLTELMKIDKIEESRPIFVMTPYVRSDINNNMAMFTSEPIEESPYTSELGKLGLDFGQHDVIAWHDAFKQANVLVSNDVVEYYIENALNKNIITKDELGGTEGSEFTPTTAGTLKGGYTMKGSAIRQFFPAAFTLHPKIKEKEIVYPEGLAEGASPDVNKVQKKLLNLEQTTDTGTLPPWGYSYYSNASNCVFANNYSTLPVELIKRPSIVDVQNGYWKYEPEVKDISKETGYSYFKKEEITVAEAYMLAYKLLLALGSESKLTETEINYLNSKYALNFSNFTAEERKATEYLIAKGIVDGANENLYAAATTSLTNEVAIDILYRIANPDARISFNPTLTALDKDMATQGFSQVTVTKTTENVGTTEVFDDVTQGKVLTDSNGNPVEMKHVTYKQLQTKDRLSNPAVYDLVYIRLPKSIISDETGGQIVSGGYCRLVTDDASRIPITPSNAADLNYGSKDEKIHDIWEKAKENLATGELMAEANTSPYVFRDNAGYYWSRYLLHKSVSSNVKMTAFTQKQSYTFSGIRGEGMYVIDDSSDTGSFLKVDLTKAKDYESTKRMYSVIAASDISVRNFISNNLADNSATFKSIGSPVQDNILWSQTAYMAPQDDIDAKISSILLGTEDKLLFYTYNGKQLIEYSDTGVPKLKDDFGVPENIRECFIGLVKDGNTGMYTLQYQSPYQGYMNNAVQDVVNRISYIGTEAGHEDDVSVPGYAKINSNGETVAIVSKAELESTYGIEAKSDKMLFNPSTGQRAFFNTIDSTTMIGNNITKYADGQMLVTATGDGPDKMLYYNLQAALELMNDTNTVAKTVGANIYTAIGDRGDALKRNYRLIDVKDVAKGTASSNYTTVDRTYIENSTVGNTSTYYMNMSALGGPASNFIYYKNKELDLNVLMVYTAYNDNTELKQYAGPASVSVDNSILKATSSSDKDNTLTSVTAEGDSKITDSKYMLLETLFGVSESDSVNSLLKGNYNLDFYILSNHNVESTFASKFSDFISLVTDNDSVKTETLKKEITKIDDIFKTGTFSDFKEKDSSTGGPNINIGKIQTASSILNDAEFVQCADSGNLYYRIFGKNAGNKLESNVATIKDLTGMRFYYDRGSNLNDVADDKLLLRTKVNYTGTGDNYIPLEMYSMPEHRNGFALADSSGKYCYNLSPDIDVKLTSSDRTSASNDANVYIAMKKDFAKENVSDIGLATMIELPYRSLTNEQLKTLFAENIFRNENGTHAAFLNSFFKEDIAAFNSAFGYTSGSDSSYSVEEALGVGKHVVVNNGWNFGAKDDEKEQFFQGMWHITASSAYYMPQHLTKDEEKFKTYALIVGSVTTNSVATKDAICYLGEVVNIGNSDTTIKNIKPIKAYSDLPKRLRDYLETGNADCLTKAPTSTNNTIGSAVVAASQSYTDKPIRFIFKPAIAVPAGTTLLTSSQGNSVLDKFILAPHTVSTESNNSSIRGLRYTAKDVVNTCLALAQEKDAIFLYQVPKGARVVLGDMDLLKYSDPAINKSKLSWVRCITAPTTSADGMTIVAEDRDDLSETSLLMRYMTQIYNIQVPIAGGAADIGAVSIGSVMGPGAYRIPTATEAEYVFSSRITNTAAAEIYKNIDKLYAFSVSDSLQDNRDSYITYNPIPYAYVGDKMTVSTGNDAAVLFTLNLPPSLQVEMDPNIENTYRVVGYWDINNFSVDPTGEMVAYIKARDTDVVSISDIMKDIKAQDLSGLPYMNVDTEDRIQGGWGFFTALIVIGVPAVVLIIWIWMATCCVVFNYPKPREWAENINKQAGWNFVGRLTIGIYSPDSESLNFGRFTLASFIMFFVLTIFWGKYILIWAGGILDFILNRPQ